MNAFHFFCFYHNCLCLSIASISIINSNCKRRKKTDLKIYVKIYVKVYQFAKRLQEIFMYAIYFFRERMIIKWHNSYIQRVLKVALTQIFLVAFRDAACYQKAFKFINYLFFKSLHTIEKWISIINNFSTMMIYV